MPSGTSGKPPSRADKVAVGGGGASVSPPGPAPRLVQMPEDRDPLVWVLSDDRAGNTSQALGVAEALGWEFVTKEVRYTWAGRLPNLLRQASLIGVDAATGSSMVSPWPDLVIAAGRRTAPVARWIKRRNPAAYLCQIMWPGASGLKDFDLIAVPSHDHLPGLRDNVMRITGAPHRVTETRLAIEAARWHGRLGGLKRPLFALIVGGSTKNRTFTPQMASDLGEQVGAMVRSTGGSLVVTTSRRTGREAEAALLSALPAPSHLFRWGDGGENPYFGYLAHASAVIVTGDSVSMASEACATQAPVYIYAPPGLITPKHARLHQNLYALGLAEPLAGTYRPWTHPSLNAATDIAATIRRALVGDRL